MKGSKQIRLVELFVRNKKYMLFCASQNWKIRLSGYVWV